MVPWFEGSHRVKTIIRFPFNFIPRVGRRFMASVAWIFDVIIMAIDGIIRK